MEQKLMPFKIQVYGLSDIGLQRENNEDVWAELPEEHLYVLADGMGGHQAGEVASSEAVSCFCELMRKVLAKENRVLNLKEMRFAIKSGIELVNQIIYEMGRGDEILLGMGTTLCCLHFHEEGIIYAHVGDSRIYRLRNDKLSQLTKDHSLLRELVDKGSISESDSKEFAYRNIITKAVGTEPYVTPTVQTTDYRNDDLYLMCSDGLTDLISKHEIETVLKENPDLKNCAEVLVQAAKDKGGFDNITVVLLKLTT